MPLIAKVKELGPSSTHPSSEFVLWIVNLEKSIKRMGQLWGSETQCNAYGSIGMAETVPWYVLGCGSPAPKWGSLDHLFTLPMSCSSASHQFCELTISFQ